MLPDIGTYDRGRLEEEALQIGIESLNKNDGKITDALYEVYEHFRSRFIEERGLMDAVPSQASEAWSDALTDARRLEHHVSQCWATSVVEAHARRRA